MTKTTMTPREAAEFVSDALGVGVSTRQLIHWARHASAGFPPLAQDLHRKHIYFDRPATEAWAERHRVPNNKHAPRDPNARQKVVRRGRRPRA